MLCWCIYSSHSAQLENTWCYYEAQNCYKLSTHTHTCLIVQEADGAVLVGCNGNRLGWMADNAVNQLAACRGW